MPIQEKKNISLGLGTLELGTYTNDVFDGYTDVGAIKATANLQINRQVNGFQAGRPLVTIIQDVISEAVVFTGTLAEVSLATIKMALGQGVIGSGSTPTFLDGTSTALRGNLQPGKTAVTSGTLLKFGGINTHAYVGLRFTHPMGDGVSRLILEMYKASPSGDLALPFNETDWNTYGITFNALADTCKPAGEQYFQLFREFVDPTPACP